MEKRFKVYAIDSEGYGWELCSYEKKSEAVKEAKKQVPLFSGENECVYIVDSKRKVVVDRYTA